MTNRIVKRNRKRKNGQPYLASNKADTSSNENDEIPVSITLIQYNEVNTEQRNIPSLANLKGEIQGGKVNWFKIIGIPNIKQMSEVCLSFGLHNFDVRDILSDQNVVKVVPYPEVLFVLMSAFHHAGDGSIEDIKVALILGSNFIISFQDSTIPIFEEVQAEITQSTSFIRQRGSNFLLYILLDTVNSLNINTIMNIEEQLESVEDQLIMQQSSIDMLQLLRMRRVDYMHIKRSIVSLREEYKNLLNKSNNLINESNLIYFNNFDDRLRTTLSDLETFHESLLSLLDVYYNNNNLKMNEIMKRLTLISTIFIPLTFLVGVWGMNFEGMVELKWKYGYAGAWALFLLTATVSIYLLVKKRWF